MFNNKMLAPIYFIAFISCFVVFLGEHELKWLAISGIWLVLGIYYFIKYNKSDNDLKK